jgi:hypothetical protein
VLGIPAARTHPSKYHAPVVRSAMPHNAKTTDQARDDEDGSRYEGRSGDNEDGPAARMEAAFHRAARVRNPQPVDAVESVLKLWLAPIAMPCSSHWVLELPGFAWIGLPVPILPSPREAALKTAFSRWSSSTLQAHESSNPPALQGPTRINCTLLVAEAGLSVAFPARARSPRAGLYIQRGREVWGISEVVMGEESLGLSG